MRFFNADEGVSESLGFVLVALILTTVMAMILMIGYPIYQESINEAHMQNMEEGFYLLSANMNKVALYESPVQSSELKLYGGTLSLHDDGDFKITYRYYDNIIGADKWSDPIALNPHHQILEYSLSNQKVAYVMGGVLKKDGSNSVVVKDPIAYQYTGLTKTMVIPMIEYDEYSISALAGAELARIVIRSPYYLKSMNTIGYLKTDRIDGVKEIKIEMTSEYNDALGRYFMDKFGLQQDPGAPLGQIILKQVYEPLAGPGGNTITLYIPHSLLNVNMN